MTQRTMLGMSLGLLILVMSALLMPYAIVGPYWGSIWFYAAYPFSFLFEDWYGIGMGSYLLIFTASFLSAALWAILLFVLINLMNLMYRLTKPADDPAD